MSYDAGPKALIDGSGVSRGLSPNLQNELKISVSRVVRNGKKKEVSETERVTLRAKLGKRRTLSLQQLGRSFIFFVNEL